MTRMLLAAWVPVLLVACGRNHEPPAKSVSVPAVEAAAPAAVESKSGEAVPETGAAAPLVFHVKREGGGGIDAIIKKLDLQDQATNYARVPASGIKVMDKPCEAGERFRAEPMIDSFQLAAPKECSARLEFTVLSTLTTFKLMKSGDDASAAGNFTLAQSNYGLAADRLAYAKPEEARRLRVLSTVAAGRVLGVTQPVKGADGKEQPTVEFKDRVRVFQRDNGIEATGELDARTRESIGRMELRGPDVVVPPAAAVTPAAGSTTFATAEVSAAVPAQPATAFTVNVSAAQLLAAPASPETAAMIHANRKKSLQATRP
jgi:hypothetical protein